MVALPLGAVLLSVILMIALMGTSSSGLSYLLFLPIMLVSYLATAVTSRSQKKRYENKLADIRQKFRDDLKKFEDLLISRQAEESKIRAEVDPEPGECISRAQRSDPRLGERRPGDPDFLYTRLGVGKVPAAYNLRVKGDKEHLEEFPKEYEFIDFLVDTYTCIPSAPVRARLPLTGSIGISGNRNDVLDITRSFLAHVVSHHWFNEVQVAAICKPENEPDWKWMQALPHLFPIYQSVEGDKSSKKPKEVPHQVMDALETELQRRERTTEARKLVQTEDKPGSQSKILLPRLLIVFDTLEPGYNHPALALLHKKGAELGVYGVFLTDRSQQVPGNCGAILEIRGNQLVYEESGVGGEKSECVADRLGMKQVELLAHALAAIQWPKFEDTSQPPDKVSFLQVFGATRVEDLPLENWWENGSPFGFLCAPIGKTSATSTMIFNLNDKDGAHGPHGLLGGMTGSGKSEVLKAIILSLAVTHHPYDLNFALIDFKGGAAFNELSKLPHTVGVVTDIESNATFAERVILALSGEIEYRKRVLEDARASFRFGRSHIDEYRGLRVKRPLPRLVIVFDEFAEFKQRNPAESKKLISIARQGRSLGVHLILATQNIDAAVDPEILQNSTFRICLRVSEPKDSVQMVGIPDAINLTRGRAYFSANTRTLYQSAFSGATYHSADESQFEPDALTRIWPDGRRETLEVPHWKREDAPAQSPATEASAVVDYIVEVARKMHIRKPPSVWPDALPERLYLPDLLGKHVSGGWDGSRWWPCSPWGQKEGILAHVHPVLGLYDFPARQKQVVFQIDPGVGGGHMLIFGSAGSGKSTFLRTLVTSLAFTQSPTDANVYILDYGGQSSLKVLEGFPHVGAVVTRLESERTERLVQLIQTEVARRNDLLRDARVDSWTDYNALMEPEKRLPALYLIIDGFRDFKQAFPIEFIDGITSLVSGGQAAGLYLIIATSLQSDITNELFANINTRLTFNQADPTEYFRIVGQPSDAKLQEDAAKGIRPGRGLLRGTPPVEFQAALPTQGETEKEQSENLAGLAEQMMHAWKGALPEQVQTLPLLVTLPEQKLSVRSKTYQNYFSFASMLGQDFQTLKPIGLSVNEDGPAFLVAGGSQQTGRTALLQTWLIGLAEQFPPEKLQFLLIDFHNRALNDLRKLPNVREYIGTMAALEPAILRLSNEITARRETLDQAYEKDPDNFDPNAITCQWPHLLVVIDDYEKFYLQVNNERQELADCLVQGGKVGTSYLISGILAELPKDFEDPFIKCFRKQGCGVLLGGTDGIEEFNNCQRPAGQPQAGLPIGRGFIIKRGKARLFQAAVCWKKGEIPHEGLVQRISHLKGK